MNTLEHGTSLSSSARQFTPCMEHTARQARQCATMTALGALAGLPTELLQSEIMTKLDGVSLGRLEAVSTAFRGRIVSAERAAEEAVLRLNGGDARLAARFRWDALTWPGCSQPLAKRVLVVVRPM